MQPDEIIVIGAHYDTVRNSPGADDNASGVAAQAGASRDGCGRASCCPRAPSARPDAGRRGSGDRGVPRRGQRAGRHATGPECVVPTGAPSCSRSTTRSSSCR
ncbi:M28 family peptidase [Cupriavidus sp. NPDC089707]|uniref:M28 family peptidase n=1 Tax=Cupriavidus sp. NPDC089707 TaxID=3363963 RepID=UPI00381D4F34